MCPPVRLHSLVVVVVVVVMRHLSLPFRWHPLALPQLLALPLALSPPTYAVPRLLVLL